MKSQTNLTLEKKKKSLAASSHGRSVTPNSGKTRMSLALWGRKREEKTNKQRKKKTNL